MKNRPIHENLDTSFVNLSALVRYLRRRQFAGNIRVELSGYEADIHLTAKNEIRVREHDRIAGRVSEGEEALQRLLIRAREPGGIINVYQNVEHEETAPIVEKKSAPPEKPVEKTEEKPIAVKEEKPTIAKAEVKPATQPITVVPQATATNGNHKNPKVDAATMLKTAAPIKATAPEPLEFSNNFEAKARQLHLAPQDWQMLLNLTAELLNSIDKSLAEANLEFTLAFEKACSEIAGDYPFINPGAGIFAYRAGKITVREQINAKLFVASINETLRRILDKLGRNPKFSNVYLITTHKILALIEKRKPLYDKFFITPQLSRIIGI